MKIQPSTFQQNAAFQIVTVHFTHRSLRSRFSPISEESHQPIISNDMAANSDW
jgi:hypothetical protein